MSFDDLEKIHTSEHMQLRGYVYQDANGNWVLDERPNLKCCCIGSDCNVKKQIHLDDTVAGLENNALVNISGSVYVKPEYHNKKLVSFYRMNDAKLVEAAPIPWISYGVAIAILGSLIYILIRQRTIKNG